MLGFLIFCGLLAAPAIANVLKTKQYEKTDYFQQTKRPFKSVATDKGNYGEFLIYKALSRIDGYKRFLFNCYAYKDNGELTEIDLIFLHSSGLYVIESKNYSGWIFGTENQKNWTQTLPLGKGRSKKSQFFNPVIQNKVHLKWLEYYLNETSPRMHSLIVFSDRCTLKKIKLTSHKHHVIQLKDLIATARDISGQYGQQLSEEQIDRLYRSLRPLTQRNQKIKAQHLDQVTQKVLRTQTNEKSKPSRPETKQVLPEKPQPIGKPLISNVIEPAATAETLTPPADVQVPSPSISQTPLAENDTDELEKLLLQEIQNALTQSEDLQSSSVSETEQAASISSDRQTDTDHLQASLSLKQDKQLCPRCHSPLTLRIAAKGSYQGRQFMGCSSFPKCWYKQPIEPILAKTKTP